MYFIAIALRCSSLIKCLEQIFTIPRANELAGTSTDQFNLILGKTAAWSAIYKKNCIFWNIWSSKMKCWLWISCFGIVFSFSGSYGDKTPRMVPCLIRMFELFWSVHSYYFRIKDVVNCSHSIHSSLLRFFFGNFSKLDFLTKKS